MRQPLTLNDIQRYENDIKQHGVEGVIRTYTDLLGKGYKYAGWARGVAQAEGLAWDSLPHGSVTGRAAVMFMKNRSGRDFTREELDSIRVDMARGYLKFLRTTVGHTPQDVPFEDMRNFHQDVFRKHGLDINDWTLETPMKLIGKYEGAAVRDRIWEKLRETGGESVYALLQSKKLYDAVESYAVGTIYFDSRNNRVENSFVDAVEHKAQTAKEILTGEWQGSFFEAADLVMRDQFRSRTIDSTDRDEAQAWLKAASRFKPLLLSEGEPVRDTEYAQSVRQGSLNDRINSLAAALQAGHPDALKEFVGANRTELEALSRQSVLDAEAMDRAEQALLAQAAPAQTERHEAPSRGITR